MRQAWTLLTNAVSTQTPRPGATMPDRHPHPAVRAAVIDDLKELH